MKTDQPSQPKAKSADMAQVRTWIEDIRVVLCVLALVPSRQPGLLGAVADSHDALARVLAEVEDLPRLDTGAALHAVSAAHAGAKELLALATGDGSGAESGDGSWWLGHAMWLIGKAQEHVQAAHAHARRPGRTPGIAPTKARIQKEIEKRPRASHKEVADAVFSSPEYVRKVRARRT
jgi:hypothetical protein